VLETFTGWFGYGLCHQLPERSFFGGGLQVPVCARDTGLYVGFVVSLAVCAWLHRGERPRDFPGRAVWAVMGLFLILFAWDGVSSYAGLRASNNGLRLITGLGVGFSAAVILIPMLNDQLWTRSSSIALLNGKRRLAIWLGCIPLTWAVVWWTGPLLDIAYPLLVIASIIATLTTINLVIVSMIPRFDRAAAGLSDLAFPVVVSVAVALGEIWAAGALRDALVAGVSALG